MMRLYFIGISILVVAILANGIIMKLGIKSWYDFIELLSKHGTLAFNKINALDYLWLFLAYPMTLGFGYWIGDKLYKTLFI